MKREPFAFKCSSDTTYIDLQIFDKNNQRHEQE
jgi:hypothetical protein